MDFEKIERRNAAVRKFLGTIPDEEVKRRNKEEADRNERDFLALRTALKEGKCVYCSQNLGHFSEKKPCFHWLLKPNGFRKKHFPKIYEEVGFHRLEAYLRWVANAHEPLKNINDAVEEGTSSKVIECTIRYKNLEWSFSCSNSDLAGHKDRYEGREPHYHFQMKVDGNVIIKYSDYHISFHEEDFFGFALKRGEFPGVGHRHVQSASIHTMFEHVPIETIFDSLKKADDVDTAPFSMQTLVTADEGTTISGDDLAELMEEHNRTKVPMAKLIQRLKNVRATTYISPGPGVPDVAIRTPRKRGRGSKLDPETQK